MNVFEQLKKDKTAVESQLAKQESWIKSNWKALAIGAAAVVMLLVVWKLM